MFDLQKLEDAFGEIVEDKIKDVIENFDESIIDEKIKDTIENFDYDSEVEDKIKGTIESFDFEHEIEKAIDNYDFGDEITRAVEDFDFSDIVSKYLNDYLKTSGDEIEEIIKETVHQKAKEITLQMITNIMEQVTKAIR